MDKNILFYSNFCNHSKELLRTINQNPIKNSLIFVCVDDRNIQIPPFINYANINLGNDNVVRQTNRTQPNYEIIKEDNDSSLIYKLRLNVYLPGCVKENVSGPTGDIRSKATPVELLIKLESSIVSL